MSDTIPRLSPGRALMRDWFMPDGPWLVLIGTAAFIFTLIVLMALPARVRIEIRGGSVTVEPLGLDKIWCVRGKVAIPLTQVIRIDVADRASLPPPGIRLPGAYMPGVIMAGSYGLGRHRAFWDVRRAKRLLVVHCKPEAAYRLLVIELPDPDATAARLQAQMLSG